MGFIFHYKIFFPQRFPINFCERDGTTILKIAISQSENNVK